MILSFNITCSLPRLGQQCPQLQDALFFNLDGFLIILLNISPHCLTGQQAQIRNSQHVILKPRLCHLRGGFISLGANMIQSCFYRGDSLLHI